MLLDGRSLASVKNFTYLSFASQCLWYSEHEHSVIHVLHCVSRKTSPFFIVVMSLSDFIRFCKFLAVQILHAVGWAANAGRCILWRRFCHLLSAYGWLASLLIDHSLSVWLYRQIALWLVVDVMVPCPRRRHWPPCSARALCPLKPWWAVMGSRYPSIMHPHYPDTLLSDFSFAVLPSILPVTTKFSSPCLLKTSPRNASCRWRILFICVRCTPASSSTSSLLFFSVRDVRSIPCKNCDWYRTLMPCASLINDYCLLL